MFLLNTHRETNALIILQDLQERLKYSFLLPLKQWALLTTEFPTQSWVIKSWPFAVQGPVAFFTQLSQFRVPRCTGNDGTFSGNEIAVSAVPCYWWDMTWQGWAPISGSAESLSSPLWGQGQGQCPALLPPHPSPHDPCPVAWELHVRSGNTTQAASPQRLWICFKCQLGYFSPTLPLSLLPLLLQDPHLAKMMKCQEEMSLQQLSLLGGISCTLIMVFVLWVVKFPSASPFWS